MSSYCSNCGTPLREGVKFCTNCGTPVSDITQTDVQNQVNRTFKPVFSQNNDFQQQPVETYQQPVDTYQQPVETNETTENYQQPVNTYEQTAQTDYQPVYETTYTDTTDVNTAYEATVQEENTKPEKKYFGVKNIFLFLLNVASIVMFFLGKVIIKIEPNTVFEGMKDGAETALSYAKIFLYTLQTAFGFGEFNSGIELFDIALKDTSELFVNNDPSIEPIALLVKGAGGIGVLFLVLAVLAAIVSLIKLFKRKKGVSSNVLSILSALVGLIIGVAFILGVLVFKDTIINSMPEIENYMKLPLNFDLDIFAYSFAGICLLLLIISIATIKK